MWFIVRSISRLFAISYMTIWSHNWTSGSSLNWPFVHRSVSSHNFCITWSLSSRDHFIIKPFHQVTLSSSNPFITWPFHHKTVSSHDPFITKLFHHVTPLIMWPLWSRIGLITWMFNHIITIPCRYTASWFCIVAGVTFVVVIKAYLDSFDVMLEL